MTSQDETVRPAHEHLLAFLGNVGAALAAARNGDRPSVRSILEGAHAKRVSDLGPFAADAEENFKDALDESFAELAPGELGKHLLADSTYSGAALWAAGTVVEAYNQATDGGTGLKVTLPNLPAWTNEPLRPDVLRMVVADAGRACRLNPPGSRPLKYYAETLCKANSHLGSDLPCCNARVFAAAGWAADAMTVAYLETWDALAEWDAAVGARRPLHEAIRVLTNDGALRPSVIRGRLGSEHRMTVSAEQVADALGDLLCDETLAVYADPIEGARTYGRPGLVTG